MKLRQLNEEEKQLQRAAADQLAATIQRVINALVLYPVTGESSYNHALGAVQHLSQAITDLDYYTRVL